MISELIEEVRQARAALAVGHGYDRVCIYEWAKATHEPPQQALRHDAPHSADEAAESGESLAVAK